MTVLTRAEPTARPDRPRAAERRPLNLLHFVSLKEGGDVERVAQSLCIALRRREHVVHLATICSGAEDLEAFRAPLAAAGVRVHGITLGARALLGATRVFAGLAAEALPDVVHTHGCWPDILGGWAARRAGVPAVSTLYGLPSGTWRARLSARLQRVLLRRFDAVAVVSPSLAGQLARRVTAERIRTIPTAWFEPEAPLGRAAARRALAVPYDQHQVIGWVGSLRRDHGLDLALSALALLSNTPATLVVVGDGPERAEYEHLATRLNVADRVYWRGRGPEADRLFGAFDAFLLSSRTERMPLVLFQAMATRTPIVATAVGMVPGVLPRGTALVVPQEDPQALADALRSVFDDPRHATARATAARTRLLTKYSPHGWVDDYEALYREVSQRPP